MMIGKTRIDLTRLPRRWRQIGFDYIQERGELHSGTDVRSLFVYGWSRSLIVTWVA